MQPLGLKLLTHVPSESLTTKVLVFKFSFLFGNALEICSR